MSLLMWTPWWRPPLRRLGMRLKCSQGRGSVGAGTGSHFDIFFSHRLSSHARSGFTPKVGIFRSTASPHSVFAALRTHTEFHCDRKLSDFSC